MKGTPRENVRDAIIKAEISTMEESGYAAGNKAEKLLEVSSTLGKGVDYGTQLVGGAESASALGRIAFKTTKDAARSDVVCTGLCLVAGTYETFALGRSTLKFIPYRGQIYVGAKIVSQGCMSYRNLCAAEGC